MSPRVGGLTRVGDIDLPQHLRYERRAYRVRQIFAVVFGLVLLAGLLGCSAAPAR